MLSFIDDSNKSVIGETYESTLFETDAVDTSTYDASMEQFLFFTANPADQVSLLVEISFIGLFFYIR